MTNDIHCVTAWSKFDNTWTGVRGVGGAEARASSSRRRSTSWSTPTAATRRTCRSTTSTREGNLFAHTHNGESLTREHGWPLRLVVPHLYFWKSAKWVRGLVFLPEEQPGFWEMYGYHIRGDPWKEERYS